MGWILAIAAGVVLLAVATYLWRWRSDRQTMRWLEARQAEAALRNPNMPALDYATARRLHDDREFDELRQFFGGYFYQHWSDEYGEDEVVQAYLEDNAHLPEDVDELLEGMDALLALGLDDEELYEALDVLGSYLGWNYFPDGATSAWVRSLREKLITGRQKT